MQRVAQFAMAGISYRTTALAVRERFAVPAAARGAAIRRLAERAGLAEVVVLWTCNRVEVYGVPGPGGLASPRAWLHELAPAGWTLGAEDGYAQHGPAAIRHLGGVAAGLDSLVLGETEIAGQVKEAYASALAAGRTGPCLNRIFQSALGMAKAVRSQTGIGRGLTSLGSVVALRAREFLGDLAGRRVLLLGAGRMAETCLSYLIKHGATDLVVLNRSLERAEQLVAAHGGRAVPQADLEPELAAADLVVCSTGCPVVVLDRPTVARAVARRPERPLVLVDIAVPRDVDPAVADLPGVHLCDLDGLEEIVRRNLQGREDALAAAWRLIGQRADEVWRRLGMGPGGGLWEENACELAEVVSIKGAGDPI